ncbi:hypothetical protein EUGRSUZ_F02752, partial [Eucalyptus grandis]
PPPPFLCSSPTRSRRRSPPSPRPASRFAVEIKIPRDMAVHDESETSGRKESEEIDVPIFSAENMQSNMKVIYYSSGLKPKASFFSPMCSRTFMSIIGGVIAGILGFTGLTGFVIYFLVMAITSIGLIAKTGFSIHSYFTGWSQIILDGFLGGLMVCLLFWSIYLLFYLLCKLKVLL